jgi:hypothetical protein
MLVFISVAGGPRDLHLKDGFSIPSYLSIQGGGRGGKSDAKNLAYTDIYIGM